MLWLKFHRELSKTLNIAKSVECIELFECFEPIIELKNLDQTSAWVCLAKARNTYSYVITTWTNPCNNFNKSMLQVCRRGGCQFLSDPSPIIGNACQWLTDWLTYSLTDSVTFSKLDWCDPGVWRCQLKTCWCCFCCGCWWWGSCWQLFLADLGADVWS